MKIKILNNLSYQVFPETEDMVEFDEKDLKQIGITKQFENGKIVNYFNQEIYEDKIVAEIRKKYTVNQELAILRQRDTKPEEFAEYNEYVEQCKQEVKNAFNKE